MQKKGKLKKSEEEYNNDVYVVIRDFSKTKMKKKQRYFKCFSNRHMKIALEKKFIFTT